MRNYMWLNVKNYLNIYHMFQLKSMSCYELIPTYKITIDYIFKVAVFKNI